MKLKLASTSPQENRDPYSLLESRTKDQKKVLLEAVSRAVHESINAPLETIRIWIQEFPQDEYMMAGVLASERNKINKEASKLESKRRASTQVPRKKREPFPGLSLNSQLTSLNNIFSAYFFLNNSGRRSEQKFSAVHKKWASCRLVDCREHQSSEQFGC